MKKSNWFDTVFLPSMFEYAGIGVSKKISEKQFDCFVRQRGVYKIQHRNQSYFGSSYVTCCEYQYSWNGRCVSVLHGRYGYTVTFNQTEEEQDKMAREYQKKQYNKEREAATKLKARHPDEFQRLLQSAEKDLLRAIQDFNCSAASENDEEFMIDFEDLQLAEEQYYKYYFA